MKKLTGKVHSLHVGIDHGVIRDVESIQMALDGVVGDRYQSYTRKCWAVDKQPKGTLRRNERQWSASSREELEDISEAMNLDATLDGNAVSVNLVFSGIPNLSALPKGTLLTFASGAELTVVEYNPPCREQGIRVAERSTTKDGGPPSPTAFPKAAKLKRGVVGVVDVAGEIRVGDVVTVGIYEPPAWLTHPATAGT
ncbi:MAG: hypothetical protein R3288_14930 [Woeseiaceae bacterium]|nr:hypothetical protein [Woeseiaceae bacterium]